MADPNQTTAVPSRSDMQAAANRLRLIVKEDRATPKPNLVCVLAVNALTRKLEAVANWLEQEAATDVR